MHKTIWYVSIAVVLAMRLESGTVWAQLPEGSKAPTFTIKTLDGKTFDLKPLISPGKQQKSAVVLSFWAPLCPPCRSEAPHLQKLYEDYNRKGIAFVGIATGADGLSRVQRFVTDYKLAYTVGWDPDETKAALKYRFTSIPALFIIDSKGVIRRTYSGYYPGMEKKIAKKLDHILAEQAKSKAT